MHLLSPPEVLNVWERGLRENVVERALTLLSAAYPSDTRESLAALSVGQRDVRLLAVHEGLFGPELKSYAECPRCGAQLEFTFDAGEVRSDDRKAPAEPLEFTADDVCVRFRLPNSFDLAVIWESADLPTARRRLSERCIIEACQSGVTVPASELPEPVIEELAAALAVADAQADTVLTVRCGDCQHGWELVVDIVSFLWSEVHALAKRLLEQVHTLAWAYGWREDDILAMSDARRQYYLDMVG